MNFYNPDRTNLVTGDACKQISFKACDTGRLVPVYRHSVTMPWLPCIGNEKSSTPGFTKWRQLLRQGYEVVKL